MGQAARGSITLKASDRILLILSCLLGIAGCAAVFAVVWGFLPFAQVASAVAWLMVRWQFQVLISMVAVLIALLFIRVMFIRQRGKSTQKLQGTISVAGAGDISISKDAVSDLCIQKARESVGVLQATCLVETGAELQVLLTLQCGNEASVPEIAKGVQQGVQDLLQTTCGMAAKVRVLVEKAQETRPTSPVQAVVPAAPQQTQQPEPPVSEGANTNG